MWLSLAKVRFGGGFLGRKRCVTLFTTKAEYVAMTDGAKEDVYIRGVGFDDDQSGVAEYWSV